MKKKLLLACMVVCILAVALVGGSLAATAYTTNQNIYSNVQTPTLQVELTSDPIADDAPVKPGDVIAQNYAAANPAANTNITEYVRVTITKYWKDAQGEKLFDKNAGKITMGLQGVGRDGDWLKLSETAEQVVLIYKAPLEAGKSTGVFLKDLTLDKNLIGYEDCKVGLDVTAEAVQYVAGENELNARAILSSWGVVAQIDDDGIITAVSR